MRTVRILALLVLLLVLTPLFSGCAGADEINIGVYEPITGSSAAGGQMTWEGIQLANEMYPEVLGKKVRLYLEDNKTDKAEAANAVTRLIDQKKVVAIVGSYGVGAHAVCRRSARIAWR
ncbi:MAG: ABC transporter substrate-binding protein [Bacillota bacterium]